MYLYLDESGDLGFDFQTKKPSTFFVITLFVLKEARAIKFINKAIEKTLDKKLNAKNKNRRIVSELKGNSTTLEVKKYFLNCVNKHKIDWSVYSIVLNKHALLKNIKAPMKDRVYNHMTHQLLEKINFPTVGHVNLIVDKSKNNLGIKEFNESYSQMLCMRENSLGGDSLIRCLMLLTSRWPSTKSTFILFYCFFTDNPTEGSLNS